ncbi:sialic acid-binding Ig-like lectin 5 isoform X2 [Piliocolobus tephrosceles]|uniref:sialic acid-binding Ig-like lectin 5 isoform X2 n=1 Tax=Piliocolobus tephrosceles TaxID=591936 RepID=UPI000E6AE4C2|nr:sialic acid-binding Ig-like lectin 5 isoform X2 [Piliocolobus tephrosceles]
MLEAHPLLSGQAWTTTVHNRKCGKVKEAVPVHLQLITVIRRVLDLPILKGSLQEEPGYELQVQKSVTVQEGLCVLVPCSFSYPWTVWYSSPPLYIYWFLNEKSPYYDEPVATNNPDRKVKSETQGRFRLLGDVRNKNCSLSIGDARMEDTGIYSFRVERGRDVKYTYIQNKLNLEVTALTEKPDVHFLEPLESGRLTRLSCSLPGSCGVGRPLTFSWTGDALSPLDPETTRSSELTLTPRPEDHGTNLTCQVKRRGAQVTTERTVQLNVSYAPQNITIFRNGTALEILQNTSTLLVPEGQALWLLCEAPSNPPAHLSWFQASSAPNATPISNTGILALPRVEFAKEGVFTCRAQHPLGSLHIFLNLSVYSLPQLLGPSCSWEAESLHCSCSFRAWPAPSLCWWLGEKPLEGNSSQGSFKVNSSSARPWTNSSLILHGGLTSGLKVSCKGWYIHGSQSSSVLLLQGSLNLRTGVVPAALGGAGVMALLCICLCLIFFLIVKVRRKQAAGSPEQMDDEDPIMGTISWDSRKKPWSDSPGDQASPAGDTPPLGEQQELHYASLSFSEMKSRETKDQEAPSTTEYSEVKTSK